MDYRLFIYVFFGGLIGGVIFLLQREIGEVPIEKPSDRQKINAIKQRFLDLLFGVAGGILIFIILPAVPADDGNWEILKIIGLAIVGGYGGQVIVNMIASQEIADFKKNVNNRLEQVDSDLAKSLAFDITYQWIHSSVDIEDSITPKYYSNILNPIKLVIFRMIEARREEIIFDILGADDNFERDRYRQQLIRMTKPLQVLINQMHNEQCIHELYATQAYLYKDSCYPDKENKEPLWISRWEESLEFISKAIERRKESFESIIYRKTRLIILINLEKDKGNEMFNRDFEIVWKDEIQRNDLMRMSDLLGPGIRNWLVLNKPEEVKRWLKHHEDESDKWLSSISIKLPDFYTEFLQDKKHIH